VGTRFAAAVGRGFYVGPVSSPIRPVTGRPSLLPTSQCHPSIGLPYGWLALHRGTGRSDDLSTFHMTALQGQLRWAWTPVAQQSRTGTLETCNLATHANTGKHAFDLITPVGLQR